MDVLICDINSAVVRAAQRFGFTAHLGSILDIEGILVSPANSFGFMDGGIDNVYRKAYPGLEQHVQRAILTDHGGELPVGQATYAANNYSLSTDCRHPYVIVAPTMRTPATDLRGSMNAYLAARAAYQVYKKLSTGVLFPTKRYPLLMPGLGTASGRMDIDIAVAQMVAGIDAARNGSVRYATWPEQKTHECQLSGGSWK